MLCIHDGDAVMLIWFMTLKAELSVLAGIHNKIVGKQVLLE